AAMKIDAEFKLARVTLGQYEQVIARIRAKADTLALSKRQLAALKADKVAHNDSLVAQRLIAIAREKGDAKQPRRLAALTYLVGFYNPKGRNHGRISRFQDRFDRFAIRSRAGTLARRYFVEAQTVFPAVPLFTRGRHPPDTVALIPKRIAGMTASLAKGLEYRVDNRLRGVARNLTMVQRFAHLIGADRRETIRLHELAAAKLAELRAEPRDQISVLDDLSKHYLAVGDVAAASGALTRKSALMTNPNQLKRVARELEELKALAQQLAQTDKKRIFVELIAHNKGRLSRNTLKQFVAGKPSKRLLRELARAREPRRWWSHRDPHWFWGSQPARLIQGEHQIITGPRTDGLRSNAIRYHRDASRMNRKDVLVAIGRVPLHNLDAAFELRRKPAKDFWPLYAPREATGLDDLKLDAGVPEVSFIIGLRDIDTRQERNPETRKRFYPRPTRGIAIRILPKGVLEIAQLGEKPPAEKNRLRVMTLKTLARKTGVRFSNGMKVRVRVRGAKVVVTVGRAKLAYTLPKAEATEGFLGLHFRGFGYTEVRNPKVKRK
ncbi:MAG: hypothetical protein KC502_11180, partial [Myxococcales bacterium]|nr:hypothetical protein [Myxococcales bacterium]